MRRTIEKALEPYDRRAHCPLCGAYATIYFRVGDELVCGHCEWLSKSKPVHIDCWVDA